jgi:hypothetical protein
VSLTASVEEDVYAVSPVRCIPRACQGARQVADREIISGVNAGKYCGMTSRTCGMPWPDWKALLRCSPPLVAQRGRLSP